VLFFVLMLCYYDRIHFNIFECVDFKFKMFIIISLTLTFCLSDLFVLKIE
jgi:hypothetical protein